MMKKRLMKTVMVSFVVLTGAVLTACGSQKEESKTTKKETLVVGVDDTFVPMGFRDENDEIVGFDIDLAKEVGKELGMKTKIQPVDWSMKETELLTNKIDVIWNGYTVTPEREKKVAFTMPYLKNEQVIVVLKDSGIKTYADFKNKKVGAQEGSSGEAALLAEPEKLLSYTTSGEPIGYPIFTEAFLDLKNKQVDGFIIDSVYAEYYISKSDDGNLYDILPSEFEEEDYAVGVNPKNKGLVEDINKAFVSLKEKGKVQEISKKWFGDDRTLIETK